MNNESNINNNNNINSISFFNCVIDSGIEGINEMISVNALQEEDRQGLIMELKNHCRDLFAIAQHFSSINPPTAEEVSSLPEELLASYETYVKPFESSLGATINEKLLYDDELSEEELMKYNNYAKSVKEESGKRLHNNDLTNSYYVIIYSIRLTRLLSLNAPLVICANEAHNLAEAMVALKYGLDKPDRES